MSKRYVDSRSGQLALPVSKRRRTDTDSGPIEISKRKRTTDDYTVGWICPLEVEQIAAMEMLDEEHERLPQAPTDHNVYNLGSIAGHNVVIAGLHQAGNCPAATVVTQMRMTFRNLKFGLLVGIGGGVPVMTDNGMIRLGDVVVSKPTGGHSGAIQCDRGKATVGDFERTGVLAPPPAVLLNAAQDLAAKRARSRQDPVKDNIKRIDTSIRGLRRHKRPEKDYLYEADYLHPKPGLSCDQCECDPSRRVQRPTDNDDDDGSYIVVHRGTIASGETVIEDAMLRDELAEKHGLLCFETEAAGALTDFPCLVIRGISDYCDSHKNNQWDGYAAAAAAAYSRQLFFHMPIDEVKRYISETTEEIVHRISARQEDQVRLRFLEWLSPTNFSAQQHDIISRRQDGTAQWFLDSLEFQEWLHGSNKTLFCPGIPGAGKTMMAAVTIDFLHRTTQFNTTGTACLFCSYKSQVDQGAADLLASIQRQLAQDRSDIMALVTSLHERHSKRHTKPSVEDLTKSLMFTCENYSTVYIVVDALDECTNTDLIRHRLVEKLFSLQENRNVRLLFTSRFIPEVTRDFSACPWLEVRASKEDVSRYVAGQISRLPYCIQRDQKLKDDVRDKIVEAVDSMFLLARLHVDSLLDKRTKHQVLSALDKLSTGSTALEDAYGEAIKRIEGQLHGDKELAKRVICWISYAQRPLTTKELCCALAIEPGDKVLNHNNMYDVNDIISVCAGLVIVDEESRIIRLVHYTTQEYFECVRGEWSPAAQEEIAVVCLTYLSFDAFRGCGDVDRASFKRRLAENQFFNYTGRYWGDHVRPVQQSEAVSGLALSLLRGNSPVNSVSPTETAASALVCDLYGKTWRFPGRTRGLHLTARYALLYLTQSLLVSKFKHKYNGVNDEDDHHRKPIYYAAEGGYDQVVKLLLEAGTDINEVNQSKGSPLKAASERGHAQVVRMLLDAGAIPGNRVYVSALQAALANGHEQVMKLLLDAGADVNAQHGANKSAFHIFHVGALQEASARGYEEVVKLLLDAGADVNAKHEARPSALQEASSYGHEQVVKLLLDAGADVNAPNSVCSCPLHAASAGGYKDVVKLLLDAGADVNMRNSESALQAASARGHEEVVKLLLDAGADVCAPNSVHKGALWAASARGREQVVKQLLDAGADVDPQHGANKSALQAASTGDYRGIVKLLLDAGADVNARDGDGGSALGLASTSGYEDVVRLLLDAGADVNARDSGRGRALNEASTDSSEGITGLLLDAGANVQDEAFERVLQDTSAPIKGPMVKLLLDAGRDINARNSVYSSALHAASVGGYRDIVKLLLDAGADVCAPNSVHEGALRAASAGGHEQVVKQLLDAGAHVNGRVNLHDDARYAASERARSDLEEILSYTRFQRGEHRGPYGSALYLASKHGHGEVVSQLLGKRADVNAQSGYYGTALHVASACGHEEVVKLLLESGADVNVRGRIYGSALHAASYNGHVHVVSRLLGGGADVNIHGGLYGITRWMVSMLGEKQALGLLLDANDNLDLKYGYCCSTLTSSSLGGQEQVVKSLLDACANVAGQSKLRYSARDAAEENNHRGVVELLERAGVNGDMQSGIYSSAIFVASACGHEEVVRLLLSARPGASRQSGFHPLSALCAASEYGYADIVSLLLDAGAV